jgi:UDPglucose--hexose-1-phosphate uridylyltransferase
MAEIRMDSATNRWVIISTDNPMDPGDFEQAKPSKTSGNCPFCTGNEKMTPDPLLSYPPVSGDTEAGWSVRAFSNKFPALRIEGEMTRSGTGIYDTMNGVGAHEVIVETPDHDKELADLSPKQMLQVMQAYRERSLDLRKDKRFRYLLIFKNWGSTAGASIAHSHSQLIALPIVPKRVTDELKGIDAYHEKTKSCVFCAMIEQERKEKVRVVHETDHMISLMPFASRFPFEVWILPKRHWADFATLPDDMLAETGEMLRHVLIRLKSVLKSPFYNYLIHTSPLAPGAQEGYHFHIELMPRLTRVAGFEWGSGFYINPTPPETAAQYLRGEKHT